MTAEPTPWTATTDDVFEHWMAGKSRNTQIAYATSLDQFVAWCPDADTPATTLRWLIDRGRFGAERAIEQWRDHLLASAKASRTVALRMTAVQSLMKSARKVGMVEWRIRPEKPLVRNTRDTRGPTADEFRRVILHLQAKTNASTARVRAYAHRWLALTHLLGFCGLRIDEALSLDMEHLDLSRSMIHHTRKGTRALRHPFRIPAAACDSMRSWLAARRRLLIRFGIDPEAGPVFIAWGSGAVDGDRLSADRVRQAMNRWAARLGMSKLCPHGLRHYAITRAMDLGADMRHAQRLAGHADIQSTQAYDDARTAGRHQAETAELIARNWDNVANLLDGPLPTDPVQNGADALALLLGDDTDNTEES